MKSIASWRWRRRRYGVTATTRTLLPVQDQGAPIQAAQQRGGADDFRLWLDELGMQARLHRRIGGAR